MESYPASAGRVLCTHLTTTAHYRALSSYSRHFVHSGQRRRSTCVLGHHLPRTTLSLKERVLPESMGDLSLANPLATAHCLTQHAHRLGNQIPDPSACIHKTLCGWPALAAAGPCIRCPLCLPAPKLLPVLLGSLPWALVTES